MNKKLPTWSIGYSEYEQIKFTHASTHANKEPEGFDWVKTSVSIKVGGFSGNVELMLTLSEIRNFKNQIENIYNNLRGMAQLKTIEDQIELNIGIDDLGHIKLTGYLKDDVSSGNKLNFEMDLDQSFLPKTLSELNSTLTFYEDCA